ncbi:MAG: hypothetical protein JW388_0852 [Nitrospira sp.]|nr:hypothetical protein [Nitrospira sp.]
MTNTPPPKSLTCDEKKAADAAFAGRPFNDAWSISARAVYDGIMKALPQTATKVPDQAEAVAETLTGQRQAFELQEPVKEKSADGYEVAGATNVPLNLLDRTAAIQAGILIDVTPTALQLGITFPVTITRPLWESGIATSHSLSEEDQTGRLRDILMAFRLRLSSLTTVSPLLDFPVLLAWPPSSVPQPMPLFALIQPDPTHQMSVTLLLPNEVSLSISSLN